jgi:6-pyruvoyltetrahydropterin/6-carboxytetrahydropterin synthase
MITISKEFNWAMTHRLENHNGLCKNLHSHGYKMFVTFKRTDNKLEETNTSEEGMVCDFSTIKNLVNTLIINKIDHAFVFNCHDKDSSSIAKVLDGQIGQKLYAFNFRTTAENMAKYFCEIINQFLEVANENFRCTKIVLYETETSFATYEVDK